MGNSLRNLQLRMRLQLTGFDTEMHGITAIPPDDSDPMLDALTASAADAADALLRIHGALSPEDSEASAPEAATDEITPTGSDHPTSSTA
jgi:hypothetical protein